VKPIHQPSITRNAHSTRAELDYITSLLDRSNEEGRRRLAECCFTNGAKAWPEVAPTDQQSKVARHAKMHTYLPNWELPKQEQTARNAGEWE
jgi:hypothetical protein